MWGKDLVGRVIRAEFEDVVVVATYHPQGGFTEHTLAEKTMWETQLVEWLKGVQPIIWGGDFNVNPYKDDWTQKAWEHLRGKIGKGIRQGCREIDRMV